MAITLLFAIMFSAIAQTPVQRRPVLRNTSFVPVTGISGVPATTTAGTLTLTGAVNPENATNAYQGIAWSVVSAGTTGAKISGNTLTTTAAGTVTVRATVKNGAAENKDYTQNFTITVNAAGSKADVVAVRPDYGRMVEVRPDIGQIRGMGYSFSSVRKVKSNNGHFQILDKIVVMLVSPYAERLKVEEYKPSKLKWTSNKPNIVSVDDGEITAKALGGPVTITATNEAGHKETCDVYVVKEKIAGKTALGMGIDITQARAFTEGELKKSPVFEMDVIIVKDKFYESTKVNRPVAYFTESGASVSEVIKSFNNKTSVKYTGAFSVSADFSFSSGSTEKRTAAYTRSKAEVRTKTESITDKNLSRLKEFVTNDFREDLETKNAAWLVTTYGSHVIADCYYGGMVLIDFSTESLTKTSYMNINAQVEAKVYGVNAKTDNDYKEQQSEFSTKTTMRVFNDGGMLDNVPLEEFLPEYNKWKNGILNGTTKSSLCGFDRFNETETMFPLWEIAKLFNPTKAAAIKAEFDKRYEACGAKIDGMTQYVKWAYIGLHVNNVQSAINNLNAQSTDPIFFVQNNLNWGWGHTYALGYSRTNDKYQAITDIKCVHVPYATGKMSHNEPNTIVIKGITYTEFGFTNQPGIVYYATKDKNASKTPTGEPKPIQDIFVEVQGADGSDGRTKATVLDSRTGADGWSRVTWHNSNVHVSTSNKYYVYLWIRR